MQPAENNKETSPLAIPVTYRQEWQDGFGARGWKLDCALDDSYVIAATSETGCQINTSVLIHDILDHHLSGFPLSGHRNEAMALIQLSSRTHADPRPDYEQMVDEDLMLGTVSGESFRSFLPEQLVCLLPADSLSGKEIIEFLTKKQEGSNYGLHWSNSFLPWVSGEYRWPALTGADRGLSTNSGKNSVYACKSFWSGETALFRRANMARQAVYS